MTIRHTTRLALTALSFAALCTAASAQGTGKLKVGLMLPYSGTYTALGVAIENGFKLYVDEQGASSRAARSSTSRSTTSPIPPRPPTTSTS